MPISSFITQLTNAAILYGVNHIINVPIALKQFLSSFKLHEKPSQCQTGGDGNDFLRKCANSNECEKEKRLAKESHTEMESIEFDAFLEENKINRKLQLTP